MDAAPRTGTVRARWLARFGDGDALARRLAWDGHDEAWLDAAPGLLLAGMRDRAARDEAFLRGIDAGAAAAALRPHGPDREAVAGLLHHATGWCPHALAPLAGQIAADIAGAGGGPVQDALAATTLAAAVAAAWEASRRLARDCVQLDAVLGFAATGLCRVEAMGDPHAGGRRVLRLEGGTGTAVFLKPRPPDGERLLARLAGLLPDQPWLAPVPLLNRGAWFWMADSGPACANPGAEQAGALLALADMAGAVDLHAENVRPTAAGVAVLDAEMVLHPDLPLDLVAPSHRAAARALRRSPLRTGLLPEPDRDADQCGLAGWVPDARLIPGFIEGVLRAYAATCRRLADPSFHQGFCAALHSRGTVRLLVRPTQGYARMLSALRDPGRTAAPADAFLLLEVLRIGMTRHARRRPSLWRLPAAEQAALLGGDVPRLWMEWRGLAILEGSAGNTGATLPRSPATAVLDRAVRLRTTNWVGRLAPIERALRDGSFGTWACGAHQQRCLDPG